MASIFGTNLGDFYANERGLGLGGGLLLLAVFFALVSSIEQVDKTIHCFYYWSSIIIIRTGTTNIADFLAGHRGTHIDRIVLSVVLATITGGLVRSSLSYARAKAGNAHDGGVAKGAALITNGKFWLTMLVAGTL